MVGTEIRPSVKTQVEDLTAEQQQLKQLFYLSYYFAQGYPRMQTFLFDWLVTGDYLPAAEITEAVPEFIAEFQPPQIHMKEPQAVITKDISDSWQKLITQFKKEPTNSQGRLVSKIALEFVRIDLSYQYEGRPERNKTSYSSPDSNTDPYKSFFRRYVLNHQETGTEAFDDLFGNISRYIRRKTSLPTEKEILYSSPEELFYNIEGFNFKTALANLQYVWQQNHPGQSFFPS